MEKLKEKLQNKEVTIGSWITIGNPFIAEIMAKAGFDWLAIDMEHSAISINKCQEIVTKTRRGPASKFSISQRRIEVRIAVSIITPGIEL